MASPFTIAKSLLGFENPGPAMQLANEFVNDAEVQEEKERLIAEYGEDYFLPTKAQFAREVLEAARNEPDGRAKVGLYKLHADVRGFVTRGNKIVNVDRSHKVINVTQAESIDAWKKNARNQQTDLITAG